MQNLFGHFLDLCCFLRRAHLKSGGGGGGGRHAAVDSSPAEQIFVNLFWTDLEVFTFKRRWTKSHRFASVTLCAAPRPAFWEGITSFSSVVSPRLSSRVFCFWQNGPVWRQCAGLVELRGWRVRSQPEPRWGSRVHRWHLPSLQADQSAACPHHGIVQPHPG